MTFAEVLPEMRAGASIARAGWNGVGMRVYLLESFELDDDDGNTQVFQDCMVLVTPRGQHQPGWVPSQADVLASDWDVLRITPPIAAS